jgi:pathogenesis-related protein 1
VLSLLLLVIEQINAQSSANLLPNGAYSLTPTDQANFLNAHNAVRKAYNLNPLTWDTQLASDSAAYAAQCMDNPLTHSTQSPAGQYGENLSTYMVSPNQAFPYKSMDYHVITGWYSEEKYWSCSANTCQSGQQCGHHTQIVWAATTSVGCGVANCQYTSGGTQWFVQNAVCRYKSAGNIVGQHPLGSASNCPAMPTTIGPLTPTAPVPTVPPPTPVAPKPAPTNPPTTPVKPPTTPTTPVKPGPTTPVKPGPTTPVKPGPTTPVTAPTTPVAPKPSPVAPVPVPVAPVPVAPGTLWWSGCIANYWPTDPSTGQQYQKLTPCAWEPWKDSSGGQTWCCPNPQNEWDYSWPLNNLGSSQCPDGVAATYALAEENAATSSGLSMGAWIGIGVGIAVVIIVIIVVIIIVHKKKNDERV